MELLILLPILLGIFAFDAFANDGGSGGNNDAPPPTPTDQPDSQNDLIRGTEAADTIAAGAGDDLVLGNKGADLIEGGNDWDVLLGKAGSDTIFGGRGFDILAGGFGNDLLYGLGDEDLLIGGVGNDLIYGGGGNDVASSTNGQDTLYGDAGDDFLSGIDNLPGSTPTEVAANNLVLTEPEAVDALAAARVSGTTLYGNAFTPEIAGRVEEEFTAFDGTALQDDLLYGGDGNDTLLGDFSDTLTGGAGSDNFRAISDAGGDSVTVTDLNPSLDSLRIFVPAGTNPAVTLIDGATPAVGVTVVIAGDPVAQLQNLTAAQVPANFIQVTVG